jgi:ABC-type nitrate/sulfonate/bicarbonate transport system substrate-binding protein
MALLRCRTIRAALSAALLLSACAAGGEVPVSTTPGTTAATTTSVTATNPVTTLATTSSATAAPLRLGVTPSVVNGPAFVMAAEQTSIAAANGLEVSLQIYDTPDAALEAARAGEVDVILPDPLEVIPALAAGACFVAPLDFIDQDDMRLVGHSDLFTAEDLTGHKVGTVAGGAGEVALRMWLLEEGVDWDEVTVVDTRAEDLAASLAAGEVDAVIWEEPVPGEALAACGEDACHYIGDIGAVYQEVSLVTVGCAWQQAYGRDGMDRLVSAWLESREYLRNNVAAAAQITADRLRLTGPEVADVWLQRGWLGAWAADLTDAQLEMVERDGAYLEAAGDVAQAPEVCSWVNSDWLGDVAPSLVSLDTYHC